MTGGIVDDGNANYLSNDRLSTSGNRCTDRMTGNKVATTFKKLVAGLCLNVVNENQLKQLPSCEHVLTSLDLAILLTITERNRINLKDLYRFNGQDRRSITAIKGVQNTYAHCGRVLPEKEIVETDLKTIYSFFGCLSVDYSFLRKIGAFQSEVTQGEFSQQKHSAAACEVETEPAPAVIVYISEIFGGSNSGKTE